MLFGNYIDASKKNYKKGYPVKHRGHVKVEVYADIECQGV